MKLRSREICWTASRPISPYPSRKTLSIGWLPSYDDLGDFKKDLWDRSRFSRADESWEELESAVVRKWQGWWDFEIRATLRSNLDTEYCHKIASSLSQNWLIRSTKERVCAPSTWTMEIFHLNPFFWWMENVSKSHKQLPLAQTAPSTKRNRQLGAFPTKAAGHACRTQLGQIKAVPHFHLHTEQSIVDIRDQFGLRRYLYVMQSTLVSIRNVHFIIAQKCQRINTINAG